MRNLVLLHGFLEDASMWDYLSSLKKQYNCIAIDFPCHGIKINESVDTCESIRKIAEHVYIELNRLHIDQYDCVGHSMGAYVALELAQIDQGMEKLVFLHSNHWSDDEEKKFNRERVAKVVRKNLNIFLREAIPNLFYLPEKYPDIIEKQINDAMHIRAEVVAACSIAMKNRQDYHDWLQNNKLRCYFIQGEYDKVMPLNVAKVKWAGLAEHFFVIKKCGHMGHIEQTELIINLLKKVLC
jgi:pimeloyl-ACP methyl ester carboxylesterase